MSKKLAFIVLTSRASDDFPAELIEAVLRKRLEGFVPPEWILEHLSVINA